MKVKTSITLNKNLMIEMDHWLDDSGNRSTFIEMALQTYIRMLKKQQRSRDDLERINRSAIELNRESKETLMYQVKP